jgi:hypothetical protein
MALGQPLYTGKDTGIRLPDTGELERASNRLSDRVLGAEQFKYTEKKKGEKEFLQALQVDPAVLIGDHTRKIQAKLLEEYNQKYAKKYADRGGELTMEDKIEMQRDKDILTSTQSSMMADQERYLKDMYAIQSDVTGKYDKERWAEASDDFMQTGKYPIAALEVNPVDPRVVFKNNRRNKGRTAYTTEEQVTVGGKPMMRSVEYSMSEQEAREVAEAEIMNDEAMLKWSIKNFNELPESEKVKYLDADGDGKVSDSERAAKSAPVRAGNPIMQWAVDNSWQSLVVAEPMATKGIAQGSAGGTDAAKGVASFGSDKYVVPEKSKQPVTIGDTTFSSYYNFSDISAKKIPIPTDATFLTIYGEQPVTSPKNVSAYIVGYDEIRDAYILTLPKDPELGAWYVSSNVAVPANKMDNYLSLKVKTPDGVKTIAEIRAQGGNAEETDIGI